MNARVTEFLQKKGVIPAAVGFLSFSVGAGLGYILGKRNGDHFDVVFDSPEQLSLFTDENGNYKAQGISLHVADEFGKYTTPNPVDDSTFSHFKYGESHLHIPLVPESGNPVLAEPDPILEALLDEEERIMKREQASREDHPSVVREEIDLVAEVEAQITVSGEGALDEDDEPAVVVHKVKFPHHGDVWDQESEMTTRGPRVPYTIHQEEFFADDMGFDQATVTYYALDDIMADPEDVPIYNWYGQMGDLRFGHGTTDPDVVYIRNEMLRSEWEVVRENKSFALEFLGHQMEEATEEEIKHSNRSVPKFRRE